MATSSPIAVLRKKIQVRGVVQGVGFRPFVYNLARGLGLSGYVLNSSSGVTIEIEGSDAAVSQFLETLAENPPPLAEINQVLTTELEPNGESTFAIQESVSEEGKFALVSPDVATCADCWRDFTDPRNRRYGYPFTNCTNCGPRYTIVRDIPYDRPNTTMAGFRMCAECQAEYDDATDRRFHAQPNACPVCGPTLVLSKRESFPPANGHAFGFGELSISILRDLRTLLHQGRIVALRGLGGFHLACDAQNATAVECLRQRKRRSDKPFALMVRDLATVERLCFVNQADRELLLSPRRPIVILPRRAGNGIPDAVSPHNQTLGVMLPYTPLHYLLFGESTSDPPEFTALVMTSGNMSEEPIVTRNEEARPRLDAIADWFLLHDREIYMRADDSVVRSFEGRPLVLRRSRGYVPQSVDLGMDVDEILACGAELKSAFCLTKGRYAFLSQHIGDLENYETLVFFQETLANLKKLFRVEPRAVAYDLHPLYMSTKFALQQDGLEKIGVQHHHAHIASCMAENHLREKVIGVAFDGTGYGTDGKIWGGEFLVADFAGFQRRAHLRYVPLPGGDAGIRQPWRSALAYLRETFGAEAERLDLPLFEQVDAKRRSLVATMLERGISTVETSSCGRLFDAVASILGVRQEINFEGQAAIELEQTIVDGVEAHYRFEVEAGEPWQLDMRPTIEDVVRDFAGGSSPGEIAARFHNTVAAMVVEVCGRLRKQERLNRVCLSGGTFQNVYLLKRAVDGLRRNGFEVFLHSQVPPNDGGIALGQAVIANELMRRGERNVFGNSRQSNRPV